MLSLLDTCRLLRPDLSENPGPASLGAGGRAVFRDEPVISQRPTSWFSYARPLAEIRRTHFDLRIVGVVSHAALPVARCPFLEQCNVLTQLVRMDIGSQGAGPGGGRCCGLSRMVRRLTAVALACRLEADGEWGGSARRSGQSSMAAPGSAIDLSPADHEATPDQRDDTATNRAELAGAGTGVGTGSGILKTLARAHSARPRNILGTNLMVQGAAGNVAMAEEPIPRSPHTSCLDLAHAVSRATRPLATAQAAT